jgi:hypothetical protein
MRTLTLGRALGAALIAAAMMACSDSPTGPSGPSVEGTWTGDWSGAAVRMVLDQNGSSVSGELRVGSVDYPVSGEVDDAGEFAWSTGLKPENCTGYSSSGLQLQDGGDTLAGLMLQARQALPCGSGTRTAITQGLVSLARAF